MEQIIDFFGRLFGTESWPARWLCGTWTPFHGWLYIVADLAIWAAYFTIPAFIIMLVLRRRDLPFLNVFWLFGAFILVCGTTHLLDALAFWWPAYRLNAFVRLLTALTSWATIGALYVVVPKALTLRSPQELEREVQRRMVIEEQLRVKNQQLAAAQALAHIGSWEWDIAADKIVWSDEQYRLFGLFPQQMPLNYAEALALHSEPDRILLHAAVERALSTGEPYQLYVRVPMADGEERIVHSRGEVLYGSDGRPSRLVGTYQDVTAIKRTEQELERKAHELERSNAELERFAFVASHDLQEPLRKIRTFGDRLVTRYGDTLGDDGREKLSIVVKASERMQTLIDDLLHYSRLSTVAEAYQTVNLERLAEEVLSDLQVSIERKNAVVTAEPLPVRIDIIPGQVRQLLQNLIGNALKFHKEGEPPVVSITCCTVSASAVLSEVKASALHDKAKDANAVRTDGGAVHPLLAEPVAAEYYRIAVRDGGIGFDESYREQIFAPFQRLHNRSKYEGTGIGLAICKKVADNHRGYIVVHSAPGEGAEFAVFLPVQQPEEQPSRAVQ